MCIIICVDKSFHYLNIGPMVKDLLFKHGDKRR
jgi:hypothetical protein